MDMSFSKLQEMVKDGEDSRAAVDGVTIVRHSWMTEQQNNGKNVINRWLMQVQI